MWSPPTEVGGSVTVRASGNQSTRVLMDAKGDEEVTSATGLALPTEVPEGTTMTLAQYQVEMQGYIDQAECWEKYFCLSVWGNDGQCHLPCNVSVCGWDQGDCNRTNVTLATDTRECPPGKNCAPPPGLSGDSTAAPPLEVEGPERVWPCKGWCEGHSSSTVEERCAQDGKYWGSLCAGCDFCVRRRRLQDGAAAGGNSTGSGVSPVANLTLAWMPPSYYHTTQTQFTVNISMPAGEGGVKQFDYFTRYDAASALPNSSRALTNVTVLARLIPDL